MSPNERRASFEATIAPYLGELHGTAVRLTRSHSDADDVLQETVMRAWAFWDRFEEGTNARAWMHRILFNTFVNGWRRKKREREVLGVVREDEGREPHWARGERALGPSAVELESGLGDEVSAALDEMPEVFRGAVKLVDLGGRSYKDAADILGCPVGTVMSRLHRGRRWLQERLREYAAAEGYVAAAA
ncbi:MAG: sigma-70 family RNA polymerase sigma factor [Myxococcota bacterium]|jgi:RNA polymerase sigma-70 factor (ECF subfamily)|nr:sigma-70 family RNA polymerase sigma factor [Myxococcota bacterium]